MALPPCAQAEPGAPCGYNTNPELRRHPDGTWLLFTLGGPPLDNLTALCDAPCSKGGPKPKIGRNSSITWSCQLDDQPCLMADGCPVEQVQLHFATDPSGPWQTLTGANERRGEGEIVRCGSHGLGARSNPCNTTSTIACCQSNPAPLVLPDGKVVMLGNGDCKQGQRLPKAKFESYRIGCFTPFVASSWDKPYVSMLTHENGLASIPTRTSNASTPVHLPHDGCFAEDPVLFLHTDSATNVTRFKLLFHTFGEGANDGDGCNHGDWHRKSDAAPSICSRGAVSLTPNASRSRSVYGRLRGGGDGRRQPLGAAWRVGLQLLSARLWRHSHLYGWQEDNVSQARATEGGA